MIPRPHLTTLYFAELYAMTEKPSETTKKFWQGLVLNYLFQEKK